MRNNSARWKKIESSAHLFIIPRVLYQSNHADIAEILQ
jgi:hypothetical protein